ncbi:hypothetical protein CALVIDRAFT_150264 [Calocera viscosa TUFC12733]|uniref:Integral membrane bound transporter domain-containing protein n=1 Tax=Calocera viscosa (strain TUFC12733) TaxID=1330018 RepID=A0A167LIR7_CALVF|nr:hypothetical protein CALVIDRAFT_150264 [Calocera viscosa TUFC12733]
MAMVLHSFLAGYALSKLPRLRLAARMAGFLAIWVLTVDVGDTRTSYESFTNLGFCTLCAAGLSLISSLPLLHRTESPFAKSIVAAFGTLSELLQLSTEQMLDRFAISNHEELEVLRAKLFAQTQGLPGAYTEATFETRIGRLNAQPLRGFVLSLEKLRTQASVGLPEFAGLVPPDGLLHLFLEAVDPPARGVVEEILSGLHLCQQAVGVAYDLDQYKHRPSVYPDDCLSARSSLLQASNALRGEIKRAITKLLGDVSPNEDNQNVLDNIYHREFSSVCFYLASILEVASETWILLRQAEEILKSQLTTSRRLQIPSLTWAWLGIGQTTVLTPPKFTRDDDLDGQAASKGETDAALKEQTSSTMSRNANYHFHPRPSSIFRSIWPSSTAILRLRLKLASILRAIQRSPHARFGFKAALGTMLLTLPGFLPRESAARSWFEHSHGQWMVIAFLFVLETDTGATMRNGMWRIVGTISGAAFAYLTWLICHSNAYGLVVLVTLFQIPAGYVILRTSAPGAGVVGSVTLSVVVFIPYHALANTNVLTLATLRASWICVGITSALAIHYLVFPFHARLAFMNQLGKAIGFVSQDYIALNQPFLKSGTISKDFRSLGQDLDTTIKARLRTADTLITDMSLEFSLLPKPVALYRQIACNLRRVVDLVVALRSVRQYIPPEETVSRVLDLRMDLVSSMILILYACEHAFKSQEPVPQFLPSTQQALDELLSGIKDHFQRKDPDKARPSDMAYMFSFAESEAMAEISETLDDLLHLTTSMFGVKEWWDGEGYGPSIRQTQTHPAAHIWRDISQGETAKPRPSLLLMERHGSKKSSSASDPPCYSPLPPGAPLRTPSAFV